MDLGFGRMKLAHKFAVIGALVAAPLALSTHMLVRSMSEGISFAEQEIRGVAYHTELRGLLRDLQVHRDASVAVLRGERTLEAQRSEAAASAERHLALLKELDGRMGEALLTTERLAALQAGWAGLKTASTESSAEAVLDAHARLADQLLALMDHVANTSNLALDPDVDSYHTITVATAHLPRLTGKLSELRTEAVGAAGGGKGAQDARLHLTHLSGMLAGLLESAEVSVALAAAANADVGARLRPASEAAGRAARAFSTSIERDLVRSERMQASPRELFEQGGSAMDAAYALYDMAMPTAQGLLEERVARLSARKWSTLAGVGVAALVAAAILLFVVWRSILRPLQAGAGMAAAIAGGRLDNQVEIRGNDEAAQLLTALVEMQSQLKDRIERERATAAEALRVKVALDKCTTNVRIADREGRIVYANEALMATVRRIEPVLQQRHPGFRAERLVGESVGIFYDDPQSALSRLARLEGTASSEMTIGGRDFRVFTTAIRDETGALVGSVGEWVDRTEEKAAEREVSAVVEAAAAGDFTRQVPLEGKQGFYEALAKDINRLVMLAETGLGEVGRVLREVADGDLTQRVQGKFHGRFAQLQADANQTGERLQGLIGQIRQSAEAINTAAREIASGNADLSQRTEEQASSLQETASSMEELTSTVRQNAENARQANQLAIGASEVAVRGGNVVAEVVTTMNAIHESARKIVDIISVIDGIAFQTNILALNAAVEAARAGEQGRGFAVVATEVRNLAQRSAAAAKEIKSLISDSVEKVDAGTRLVDQAGATMQEVVGSVKRVTDIMAEITAASLEQSSGIEQVNQAVTQMDEVTQQNAALVEQAAAAAESLEEQAQMLAQACAVFRLGQVLEGTPGAPGFVERRGPNRARNVARLPAPGTRQAAAATKADSSSGAAPRARAAGGAPDDEWEEF
jgi:methyl-accepting chemotaxis protein